MYAGPADAASSLGGAPGSIGTPASEAGSAKPRTWPQCGPTKDCTLPGCGMPFCATMRASASGCQLFGSLIFVPGSSTTSGGLAGL